MNTILVTLDGSSYASQVLPYIHLLACLMDARVQLLYVIPPDEQDPIIVENVAAFCDLDRRNTEPKLDLQRLRYMQAVDYLAAQAEQFWQMKTYIECDVRIGVPADVIVEVASAPDVVLIAMATHEDSGLRRWFRGSIADNVVHAATKPVFLVRGNLPPARQQIAFKHILVPLDGSASAAVALPLATTLAKRADASIALLRAVTPTLAIVPDQQADKAHTSYHAMLSALQERALLELTDMCNELHNQDVRATPMVLAGNPAEVIVDTAFRTATDVIVMATHGATGPRRWVLGSVADSVLHTSTLPLLLVPVASDV